MFPSQVAVDDSAKCIPEWICLLLACGSVGALPIASTRAAPVRVDLHPADTPGHRQLTALRPRGRGR
jgi:hypothetical protein